MKLDKYDVTATTSTGINLALSNYVHGGDGVYEFLDAIETADGNPNKAVNILNANKHIYDKFEVHRTIFDGFILRATDCWKNKSFITAKKGGKSNEED